MQAPVAVDREEHLARRVRRGVGDLEGVLEPHPVVVQLRLAQRAQVATKPQRRGPWPWLGDALIAVERVRGVAAPALVDPQSEQLQRVVGPLLGLVVGQRHLAAVQVLVDADRPGLDAVIVRKVDSVVLHAAQPLARHVGAPRRRHPEGRGEEVGDVRAPRRKRRLGSWLSNHRALPVGKRAMALNTRQGRISGKYNIYSHNRPEWAFVIGREQRS